MKWYRPRKVEPPASNRGPIPPRLGVAAGLLGSALGILTNLYSAEFRAGIEALVRHADYTALSVLIAAVVSGAATAVTYWRLLTRRQPYDIVPGEIKIGTDALALVENVKDSIVGGKLHYLEAKRDSDQLIVFLHGLGLDAYDFRPYMVESKFHCIALTLYGFNSAERDDERYTPISLQSHVQLLAYGLGKLQKQYPLKRLTLVGFSLGADMIFFLTEFAFDALQSLKLHKALLLDPNINDTTTTISSKIAKVDNASDLPQLVRVLESARTLSNYRYLCEYMYKITAKDFEQVKRYANEVVAMWNQRKLDRFLDYLGQLFKVTDGVHVVFSYNHKESFNEVAQGAVARGLDPNHLECSRSDHFDLIESTALKERLEGIL